VSEKQEQPCIYVVEFTDGLIKVGYTKWPTHLSQRYRGTRLNGRDLKRVWHSEPHLNARANETTLKHWCADQETAKPMTGSYGEKGRGKGSLSEWYYGLAFNDVVAVADDLPREPLPDYADVTPVLELDWYEGTAMIFHDDQVVHTVNMSSSTWIAEIIIAAIVAGSNPHRFMFEALFPAFISAGQKIPPLLRDTYQPPVDKQ